MKETDVNDDGKLDFNEFKQTVWLAQEKIREMEEQAHMRK
jgi:hypothetical protein